MGSREQRWDPGGTLRRRGRLHEACGIAGLLAGSAWSSYALIEGTTLVDGARWPVIFNVVVCGTAVVLGRMMKRTAYLGLIADGACSVLLPAIAVCWAARSGGANSWLLGVPALFVIAHRVSGGAAMGVLAWGAASGCHVLLVLSSTGVTVLVPLVGPACLFAVALLIGREVAHSSGIPPATGARPSTEAPWAGDILARKYRLLDVLGEGRTGRVYAAERISDGAPVAVKVLHRHLVSHRNVVARFRREVEVAKRLPQARIARVLDVEHEERDGPHFIVMELLRGEDLGSRLRRVGRLPLDNVVELVGQLAIALDAAAACGIVHRDVQPRNVFLVGKEDVSVDGRLLDFGTSRIRQRGRASPTTRATAVMGTPGFLAPEQVSDGFGQVGPHTDVFALGCIAYLALSGRRAFDAVDPAAGAHEVLNRDPPPLRGSVPDVVDAVDWVLQLALAKRPEHRYPTAGEFARDLGRAASGSLTSRVERRARLLASHRAALTETLAT